MIIAVNTRLDKTMQPEGYEAFLFSTLQQLTKQFPQHQFLYISDKPYDGELLFEKNVQTIITGPETSSRIRLQYWLNFKVPAVLKKHQAAVFLSLDGTCSLRTKTPQCLLVSDLGFLNPAAAGRSATSFYKKNTAAFLAKATSIAAVSEHLKTTIAGTYQIEPGKINVVHPIISPAYKPLHWEEQEATREKYAAGKAYFLCSSGNNLINLLKAFTFFKKRQKSSMQLLITGDTDERFQNEFSLYKLRGEVKLLGTMNHRDLASIIAAAYAMVHPVVHDDIAMPVLQALQCGVPVVTAGTGSLPAILGEAAVYIDPANFEDIAQKMMLVFKDEDLAKQLVRSGLETIQQYQPDKTAATLMDGILKAANG